MRVLCVFCTCFVCVLCVFCACFVRVLCMFCACFVCFTCISAFKVVVLSLNVSLSSSIRNDISLD